MCPPGTWSDSEKVGSAAGCNYCPAGSFCPLGSTTAALCSKGTYTPTQVYVNAYVYEYVCVCVCVYLYLYVFVYVYVFV